MPTRLIGQHAPVPRLILGLTAFAAAAVFYVLGTMIAEQAGLTGARAALVRLSFSVGLALVGVVILLRPFSD